MAPAGSISRWQPGAAGNLASAPRTRAFGPSGPARIVPSASLATSSSPTRSRTGPVAPGGHRRPARRQRGQDRGRLAGLRLHPGGRRAGRRVRARPVPVAAADRDGLRIPGQPPAQRDRPARVHPAPVPHLQQRRPPLHRRGPAQVTAVGVVDRHQAPGLLRRLQPRVGRLAEVDPAHVAEHVRVAGLGGHLLARHQRDAVRGAGRGQLGVMADRVVVGDGQEVQAPAGREPGQLGHGHHPVGVDRVGVQVAGQPLAPGGGRQHPPGRPVGQRRQVLRGRLGGQLAPAGGHRHGQLVVRPAGRHPVQADHDQPGAGLELAGPVAGRGGVRGDDERAARAAGPAPEPARPDAAQVHDRAGPLVLEFRAQRAGSGRDLHRQVLPRRFEAILQRPAPGKPRHGHVLHLTRSRAGGRALRPAARALPGRIQRA